MRLPVHYCLKLLILFAAYYLTAKLGLAMDAASGFASLIWPPTGIALAAMVLFGFRMWPAVAAAAFLVNYETGASLPVALGIAAGNSAEALLGAYCLREMDFKPSFTRLKDAFNFVIFAALLSTMLSAIVGVTALHWGNHISSEQFPHTWTTWWIGDALGNLIFAPLILAWSNKAASKSEVRSFEYGLFVICLMLLGVFILRDSPAKFLSLGVLPYLVFPAIIWAALRLGVRTTVTTTFLLSALAVTATNLGIGPFRSASLSEALATLHLFIGVIAASSLTLAAAIAERVHPDEFLREAEACKQAIRLQKLQLENLRLSEDRFRLLVGAVKDYAIIMLDTEGKVVSWNQGAERITGYSSDEIMGKHFSLLYSEEAIKNRHPEHELEVATSLGRFEEEGWRIRKDRTRYWANVIITPLYTSTGELYGFSKITRDITEKLRAEQQLRQLNEELERRVVERTFEARQAKKTAEEANAAKSAFLANMSHEIRTPLGAVIGFSELLASESLSASERKNFVAAIKRNGELLSTIINDILDISKVEAGKLEIDKRQVTLKEILSDVTTFLNLQAQEKGLQLRVEQEHELPHTIHTDELRLRQVLINIVGNAIKFTDKGHIVVSIKVLELADQHKLVFRVQDTGQGIERDKWEKLFEPFSQVDASAKRKFGGTGLGLVLSKRLANLLGGDVVLSESVVGKGSIFTITIDPGADRVQEITAQREVSAKSVLWDSSSLRRRLEGVNVLLIDDAQDNQTLVGYYLRDAGARVDTACNGKEALNKVKSAGYDVLLMDLQMPEMDGYEATHLLRQTGYNKPIIALTAHALKQERQQCLASGFNDHIAKPINRRLLLDCVQRHSSKFNTLGGTT